MLLHATLLKYTMNAISIHSYSHPSPKVEQSVPLHGIRNKSTALLHFIGCFCLKSRHIVVLKLRYHLCTD